MKQATTVNSDLVTIEGIGRWSVDSNVLINGINKRSGFDTGKIKVMTLVICDEHASTEVKGRYRCICILLLETRLVVEFKVKEVRALKLPIRELALGVGLLCSNT